MILVTGPMSSGTRLLARILQPSGYDVFHDAEHGYRSYETAELVVVIIRDPIATNKSKQSQWPLVEFDRTRSIIGIAHLYPEALWVTYEWLCAHPDEVIAIVAEHLKIEPWACPEECINQNDKWLSSNGGPQLGADRSPPPTAGGQTVLWRETDDLDQCSGVRTDS